MSHTFDVVLLGPPREVSLALTDITARLRAAGFRTTEPARLQGEPDEPAPKTGGQRETGAAAPVAEFTLTTWTHGLTIDILAMGYRDFNNYHLGVGLGQLRRLREAGDERTFLTAVAIVGAATDAVGGFGGYQLDPDPIAPVRLPETLRDNPTYPGSPPELAVVRNRSDGSGPRFESPIPRIWQTVDSFAFGRLSTVSNGRSEAETGRLASPTG